MTNTDTSVESGISKLDGVEFAVIPVICPVSFFEL